MTPDASVPAPMSEGQRAAARTRFLALPAEERRRITSSLQHGQAVADDDGRLLQYALLARGRTWRRWAPWLAVFLFITQLGPAFSSDGRPWLRAALACAWLGVIVIWVRTQRAYGRVERALGLTPQHFS